uniref:interleukin-2 receptor subunit alpha n=1 Tax=Podarcis muralis TaxID=64176 RepID=UPI0010A0B1C5|nr:interleukin-2 receptor subunit alpha [Podarcis muralis]
MGGFYTGFGLLLIWGIFQPTTLAATDEECPVPQKIKFAKYTAPEGYVVGTPARYSCHKGYQRKPRKSNLLTCRNVGGTAKWNRTSSLPICVADPRQTLPPTVHSTAGNLSIASTSPQPTNQAGFCGEPEPLSNADVKVTMYHVGQKLRYECLEGYRGTVPFSEVSTCEASGGKNVWSKLNLRCSTQQGHNRDTPRGSGAAALSLAAMAKFIILEGILAGTVGFYSCCL